MALDDDRDDSRVRVINGTEHSARATAARFARGLTPSQLLVAWMVTWHAQRFAVQVARASGMTCLQAGLNEDLTRPY